jgi:uncharacterized protein (TIGR02246 family)
MFELFDTEESCVLPPATCHHGFRGAPDLQGGPLARHSFQSLPDHLEGLRGKAAVYKGHDTIHRTIFAKTSMTVEETAIRPIAPNVAVVVATMTFGPVITPTGQKVPKIKTRGSFTAVKSEGVWRIAHFQNTIVDPEAEKNDPITWDESGFLPGGNEPNNLDQGRKRP